MAESRVFQLSPYQVEFINRFLDPDAPPFWHLIAPIGSGKTITAVSLIGEMFRSHDAQRILILVNAALGLQYESMLRDELQSTSVIRVDRPLFRELEARTTPGMNPWSQPIVAVMSLDLAKRPEIARSLITAKWDLVLVDQAHSLAGQRAALLEDMINANAVGRLLLLGVADADTLKVSIPGLVTWNWYRRIGNLSDAVLPLAITLQVVEYERSPSEVSFLRQLHNLVKQLGQGPAKAFQASLLLRAASSSLYAAEQTLNRLRSRIAHAEIFPAVGADEVDETASIDTDQLDEFSNDEPGLGLKHRVSEADLKMVSEVLNALDEVTNDSKFQALARLLKEITWKETNKVVVLTTHAATVSYLRTSLEEMLGERVYELTGSMSYTERSVNLERFRSQGGVLICSALLVTGTSLELDVAVIYDQPRSAIALNQLLGRFFRPSSSTYAKVYLLKDLSGAIPGEEQLIRMLDKVEAVNDLTLEGAQPPGE